MARLSDISKGESRELDRILEANGFDGDLARNIIRNGEIARIMVQAAREFLAPVNRVEPADGHPYRDDSSKKAVETTQATGLVHGVFNTTEAVLAAFKARCEAKGIDFHVMFSWVGPDTAPDFDPEDPETVVVLDVTLNTLQNTFEFAWEWTMDGQDDTWRWEGMVSDAKRLRLISDDRPDSAKGDGPDFKPWTLSWRRIKLDTNVGKRPNDVRNLKSPGCALLFMTAEHPERIKATDYEKRFGFWLPGLKCTAPDGQAWQDVPCVGFGRDGRQVELGSGWGGYSSGDLAVPSFRE